MLSIPLNDIRGVNKGSTMTLQVPKGWTYHSISMVYSGLSREDFGRATLKLNGNPVQQWRSISEMIEQNQHDGIDLEHDLTITDPAALPAEGSFTFQFDRPNLKTRLGEQATAIGTGLPYDEKVNPFPVNTFTIEIDVKNQVTVTAPIISANAEVSDPQPTGYIIKRRTFEYDPAGAGEFQITDLPKLGRINRIFIHETGTGKIDKLKIERDTYKVFERKRADNEKIQKRYGKKVFPKTYVVNPTENGYGDEHIAVLYKDGRQVQDFRLVADLTDTAHLGVTVEYMSMLGN